MITADDLYVTSIKYKLRFITYRKKKKNGQK